MLAWLDKDLTTLAFCWRLERRDGATLGFTSHDRDIVFAGLEYRASPGMVPSSIEMSGGFDADNVELAGALTSNALRADDLVAGRWDGARLFLFAIDWSQADSEPLFLMRGTLGAVSAKGDGFSADLRGQGAILDAPVVEETSPGCRAGLGDARCRVDMAGRIRLAKIQSVSGNSLNLVEAVAGGIFKDGAARWIDGENAGLSSAILNHNGSTLVLADRPVFPVLPGTMIELTEGCDKRLATCAGRFGNALNFRGEPHLPGNDLLTRYAS